MALFRIHCTDGRKIDVEAASADAARKSVKDAGPVSKIKLVKGGA